MRDLWTPLPTDWWPNRTNHFSDVFGRLKPGVTLAQAQAEMDALENAVAAKFPDAHAGWKVNLTPRRELLTQRWVAWLWTLLKHQAVITKDGYLKRPAMTEGGGVNLSKPRWPATNRHS